MAPYIACNISHEKDFQLVSEQKIKLMLIVKKKKKIQQVAICL